MTENEVLQTFRETRALLDGHFLLRSGLHSRQYFQCALVMQHTRIAEQLCGALAGMLSGTSTQTVISPALGGILIGQEVARALVLRHIFAEKNAAGRLELRRGFEIAPREKFLVIEDVVTKGGRVQETMGIVRQHGGEVTEVGAFVDRSDGKVDFGIPLRSLVRLRIETFVEADCPMCKGGEPLVKPGS